MVFLSNYLSYSKLYFKNHFKYMGISISIIMLVSHIYSASMLFLYQYINWSGTFYLFKPIRTTTDQILAISLVKVKKSKGNYTELFWHYDNEFEHCQYVFNSFVTNFNCIILDRFSNLLYFYKKGKIWI